MFANSSFWMDPRNSRARRRPRPVPGADAGSLPAYAVVVGLMLGLLNTKAWGFPTDTAFYFGSALSVVTLSALRFGLGRRRTLFLLPLIGALYVGIYGREAALPGRETTLVYFYAAGVAAGYLLLALDRWLPSLGRVGDRVNMSAFAARWQFLAIFIVLAQLPGIVDGSRGMGLDWILIAELSALHLVALYYFFSIGLRTLQTVPPTEQNLRLVLAIGSGLVALALWELCCFHLLPLWMQLSTAVLMTIGVIPLLLMLGIERAALIVVALLATLFGAELSNFMARHGLADGTALEIGKILIIIIMISLSLRPSLWRSDADSIAAMAGKFQEITQAWLTRIEFDTRTVVFPRAPSQESLRVPFAEFFAPTDHRSLMGFLTQVTGTGGSAVAAEGAAEQSPILKVRFPELGVRTATAAVISRFPGGAWVALRGQNPDIDLAERLGACETRLARAMVREERLLSVASHEMRTPVTVLSMLVDELKAGSDWAEVELSFETTLNRLLGILNDLRVTDDTMRGLNVFTLHELSLHLLEAFSASAAAQGITMRLELSQQSETLLQGDPARVTIALSKILHNAIVHSHGTELVLGAFMTPGEGQAATVTWFIQDNGKGIPAAMLETLFEPFTASGQEGLGTNGTVGLGLYAAHKALALMGGEISIEETGETGTRFKVKHPVRIVSPETQEKGDGRMVTGEGVRYSERRALLVEDNKLVGELTANRLRRLIATVDWSETGTEALDVFRRTRPDLVLVDHLLPGMTGSELIEQIRQIDPKVPIIGITASTLGNECECLEQAGANLAVEKPLSFAQIELLVDELLGAAT